MHKLTCLLFAVAGQAMAAECASLTSLRLPKARVDTATPASAGQPLVLWAGGQPVPSPKAFCRVRGTAFAVPGSVIGFEVWLPQASDWNGKFLQAGNGGFAGAVPLPSLMDALQRGYAAAATDGGHVSSDGLDASWGYRRPEKVVDFGWRAVRQTTLAAQRIVRHSLGRVPAKSYFVGCSNGGRDALMVAQRFPQAFDGIISGAAAMPWTTLMAAGALIQRDLAPPKAELPPHKLPLLQAASLAACADGASFIADPAACRFDPAVLACTGQENAQCLTATQVAAAQRVYAGIIDPSNGQRLPGLAPGAEAESGNWDFWLLRQPSNPLGPGKTESPAQSIVESHFRHLVRGDPRFVLADLNNADLAKNRRRWAATLDAVNPDLSALKQRGGKLLRYHGWSDAAIPPQLSLDYSHAVQQRMGDTSDFHRLFMVPGMNHCASGAGPWQVDWLRALERWVEEGQAPQALTARHPQGVTPGATQELRPHRPPDQKP